MERMENKRLMGNVLMAGAAAALVASGAGLLAWTLLDARGSDPAAVVRTLAAPLAAPTPAATPRPTPPPPTEAQKAALALSMMDVAATPESLVAAVREGQAQRVELLLRAGVGIDAADETGARAVAAAAELEEPAMLELLAEKGARLDVDVLTAAIRAGRPRSVDFLVVRGADVSDPELLALAFQSMQGEIIAHFLAPLPAPMEWSPMTREAMFGAIQRGDTATLKLLLEKHPAPPTLSPGSQPLLAYMVAWNDLDHARMLLEAGADPNVRLVTPAEEDFMNLVPGKRLQHYLREEPGLTPLMVAASLDRPDMVRLLLDHGGDRNLRTAKYKIAALTFAAWGSAVDPMQMLLGLTPGGERSRVKISLSAQRAWVYREGAVAMTANVSTGRSSHPTPTGEFVVTDKNISRMSSIYKVKMPHFMRLNCSEVGMHAGAIPGYPASHGCIRFPAEKAKELYSQIRLGDRVSIVP